MESAALATSPDLKLIPGELADSDDPQDARQWMTIYRELVSFAERSLDRLLVERSNHHASPLIAGDADQRSMETHLRRVHSRLRFWEKRFWELAGLDLDVERRLLTYGGHRVRLTRRETQLLAFLAQHPGQFYAAEQLLNQAWHRPDLSEEQLRTYVVRLRRLLATACLPARLVREPRRGYGLVFDA